MCNRYTLVDPDSAFAEIARILGIPLNKPQWVTQRYNIGLMQVAPTIVNRGSGPEVLPMNFGYFPRSGASMINNARSETTCEKPSFKKAVVSNRCIIPTTGFIDWETDSRGKKWPHVFTLSSGRPYGMAAIWNKGSAEHAVPPNFCIVTREPNELVARIHNRMPVILREEHLGRWLDPTPMDQPEFLKISEAYPASEMHEHEVSTHINNVKHEGPECFGPPTPRPVNPVPVKPKKAPNPDQLGFGF
jgi:putative SOS response-associated peptidase YedK